MELSKLEKISIGGMTIGAGLIGLGTIANSLGATSTNKYMLVLGGAIYVGSMGAAFSKYFFSERLSKYFFNKRKSKEEVK